MDISIAERRLDRALVEREFPRSPSMYLNTGSVGRKPASVIAAVTDGWNRLNDNPTYTTFLNSQMHESARMALAGLLGVPKRSLLLTHNPTTALQLLMQSFLRKPGDELVTTTHEHGCVEAIARHLEETRGIVVRRVAVDPYEGSMPFSFSMLDHVCERTKLVLVSEINCATGWRPDLSALSESLQLLDVPLLVDGAHSPGQVLTAPSRYPLWVGSGHKWLGAPNGTGFAYVTPSIVPFLEPVWIGDKYYERKDADIEDLTRFESMGTSDVVKWVGLTRACELYSELGVEEIMIRQNELVDYLRKRLDETVKPIYRTPVESDPNFKTAMVTFYFPPERMKVADLTDELWRVHRICAKYDFIGKVPQHGLRISCHYSLTESDLDIFVDALKMMVTHD